MTAESLKFAEPACHHIAPNALGCVEDRSCDGFGRVERFRKTRRRPVMAFDLHECVVPPPAFHMGGLDIGCFSKVRLIMARRIP
ncbi:hypothetical protein [Qipengyuania spongiae]|uniref:Uncharacterized protein n=1 Tax=Qipengyuania spongiae TaxID=2909673 RepID=A0ABY5SYZ1_9SPHN|nr:hypothetical protein [Qipengyuania spongiae]UVI39550.1 hypothetical protein L1F33_00870 [Qipengyuania spongiae]